MIPMEITGSLSVVGYAVAALGPALGVAWIFASLVTSIARQPEAKSAMFTPALIGAGMVEALALIGMALAMIK